MSKRIGEVEVGLRSSQMGDELMREVIGEVLAKKEESIGFGGMIGDIVFKWDNVFGGNVGMVIHTYWCYTDGKFVGWFNSLTQLSGMG